jgi:hypothetical protein
MISVSVSDTMLHFLKNKVLEVNNGIGYVPGGSFGVGQPFPSRMGRFCQLDISMGTKRMGFFKTKQKLMRILHKLP